MPSESLFDMSKLDVNNIVVSRDDIGEINPHRFEFRQLDAIIHLDREAGEVAGLRILREDEFWVRGHIPGRPIFPGALMMETSAQLVSYYVMSADASRGFLGFGGIDGVKFRGEVTPGTQIVILGKMIEERRRRCVGATQAYVDGRLVYEGTITGMWLG